MAVLKEIYDLSNNSKFGGWCIKSKSKIADTLDLSKQSVINIMGVLESKGYIVYDRNLGYCKPSDMIRDLSAERDEIGFVIKSDGYEIASAKMKQIVDSMQNDPNVQNLDDRPKSLRGVKKFDSNVQKLDTSISYSKSISKKEDILSDFEVFMQFWNVYDKKEGKLKAMKEWKKLSEKEKECVLSHAPKYVQGKEKKYLPLPEKYLREKRFNDEIVAAPLPKQKIQPHKLLGYPSEPLFEHEKYRSNPEKMFDACKTEQEYINACKMYCFEPQLDNYRKHKALV